MSQGKEISGGRVNYYLANVEHPQREEQPPYQAECEDLIDVLGLTPDEANIFKEIWRTANERTHGKGKEGNTPLRAAQKCVHYSGRLLRKAEREAAAVSQKKEEDDRWQLHDGDDQTPDGLTHNTTIVVEWYDKRIDTVLAGDIDWRQVKRWYRNG
jgi:hypothetical protein